MPPSNSRVSALHTAVWLDSNHRDWAGRPHRMTAFRTITALLEAEPDLGARLTSAEQDDAKTLRVVELRIDPGPWSYEDAGSGVELGGGPLGFLVLRGVLMRQVELAGTCAGEILTDGDFALDTPAEEGFVPDTSSWVALTPARIAIVDRRGLRPPAPGPRRGGNPPPPPGARGARPRGRAGPPPPPPGGRRG